MMAMRTTIPKKIKKEQALPVVSDYALLEPWRNTNSGNAKWSFAKKNGKTYFIKEFLSPVFPSADVISGAAFERKKKICFAFYEKKKKLYERIEKSTTGNLVLIEEFFRFGTKYYITTEKIEEARVPVDRIANAPEEKKRLLLKTLAFNLMRLHKNGVVHADLKPNNILIKESEVGSNLIAKIIDFDASYLIGEQPEGEEVQGDPVYLAPETCRCMFGEEVVLTQKVDVFAAGLLFHLYLAGELPTFDKEYDYVHEALLEGGKIYLSKKLKKADAEMIRSMLDVDPEKRPDMETVFVMLGGKTEKKEEKKEEKKDERKDDREEKKDDAERKSRLIMSSNWSRPKGF